MYNYRVMRLSCGGIFRLFFLAGVFFGGLGGIALGLFEPTISLLGGMFLGLVFGSFSAGLGLVYTTVFNIFAPLMGGILIQVEPATNQTALAINQTEKPHSSGSTRQIKKLPANLLVSRLKHQAATKV
ncbi:MAG: hypothetical protein H6Q74_1764 [Firmicutes bacterium]|nr:hypothetical protein [Bacillota bacterium]